MPERRSDSNDTDSESVVAANIVEEIESLPTPTRRLIGQMFRATSSTDPLIDKFNDDHVTQYLEIIGKDDQREFYLQRGDRWRQFFYVVIAIVATGVLIWFLYDRDRELLLNIIGYIIAFFGGAGVGIGFQSRRNS